MHKSHFLNSFLTILSDSFSNACSVLFFPLSVEYGVYFFLAFFSPVILLRFIYVMLCINTLFLFSAEITLCGIQPLCGFIFTSVTNYGYSDLGILQTDFFFSPEN